MKNFKLLLFVIALLFTNIIKAQVTINIGTPPPWGPAGYSEVRYYYLPDVEAYYDVNSSMFIYYGNGIWLRRNQLPTHYRNYDLYGGYKVVMTDYRGNDPHIYFKEYKRKYAKGYRGGPQKTNGQKPGKGNSPQKSVKQNNKSAAPHKTQVKQNGGGQSKPQGGGQHKSGGGDGNKGNGGGGKGKK
ncbi:MAG: hypothetical protein V4667_01520 [Bacteroidota bacterium]